MTALSPGRLDPASVGKSRDSAHTMLEYWKDSQWSNNAFDLPSVERDVPYFSAVPNSTP